MVAVDKFNPHRSIILMFIEHLLSSRLMLGTLYTELNVTLVNTTRKQVLKSLL